MTLPLNLTSKMIQYPPPCCQWKLHLFIVKKLIVLLHHKGLLHPKSPLLPKSSISPNHHNPLLDVYYKINFSHPSPTIHSSPFHSPSRYHLHENTPLSPKFQTPQRFPLRRTSMSLSHAPSNPPIINLNPKHLDLNIPIVNLSKGETEPEKAIENVTSLNPDL